MKHSHARRSVQATAPGFVVVLLSVFGSALAQGLTAGPTLPGTNINVVGPTRPNSGVAGRPNLQQNEPDGVLSPTSPGLCAIGVNDYRAVNDPRLGDAYPGLAESVDGCQTFTSSLIRGTLIDTPSIGQKGGADPNLEAVPYMMFYNYIAFWRDDSRPGGIYTARYYEHLRETGPGYEFLDNQQNFLGTPGKFLDKPAFEAFLKHWSEPPIPVQIPAFEDPRNPENSHAAYTLQIPAVRLHLCYALFRGNDNNDGTTVYCAYSDDAGVTYSQPSKLTESLDINQGVSLASRNSGQELLACWLRFRDNNEDDAIVCAYSSNGGQSWGSPTVATTFCPFNQGTGAARFRTNALPVVQSDGTNFQLYFASRNNPKPNGNNTCIIPAKGNKPAIVQMSPVAPEADFDTFGETDTDGDPATRNKDNQVRMSRNFSRIMMMTSENAGNGLRWSTPVAIDPEETTTTVIENGQPVQKVARRHFHQYRPAAATQYGHTLVSWKDSRFDRLNLLKTPLANGYIEDVVVHLEAAIDPETGEELPGPPWQSATLLPAGIYELEPPPPWVPAPANNFPLRRNTDVVAAQVTRNPVSGKYEPLTYYVDDDHYPVGDATGTPSPSVRVTRFATRLKRDAAGSIVIDPVTGLPEREQAEYHFPNARLFQKGTAAFTGDYEASFTVEWMQDAEGHWVSTQRPLSPGGFFESVDPRFQLAYTSNQDVRGRVFYTGCDVWNEALQMWEGTQDCASEYVDPNPPAPGMLYPLQGEDGGFDQPILACSAAALNREALEASNAGPLTRNQNVYTAAMRPGLRAEVLSAVKDRDLPGAIDIGTFVVGIQNGTASAKQVRLDLVGAPTELSFDRKTFTDGNPLLSSIEVFVPASGINVRTAFDTGDKSLPDGILEVYDVSPGAPERLVARLLLKRDSILPLESVRTDGEFPVDILDGETYEIDLLREVGVEKTLDFENIDIESLDFENQPRLLDFENSAELLDYENSGEQLDFENTLIFLDFENTAALLDFENTAQLLDFENTLVTNLDFENDTYSLLDFENLDFENNTVLKDVESLDFENQTMYLDFENLDFENRFLEALDFENLDFENLDFENTSTLFIDVAALDFENEALLLDFENTSATAASVKNQDLANLDFENTAVGDESVQITWTVESNSNTTTGVDLQPIFSQPLIDAIEAEGSQILISIRRVYYTTTVSLTADTEAFCTPQIVARNQILYAAILTPEQITTSFLDPDPSNPLTPALSVRPDDRNFVTIQILHPPAEYDTFEEFNPHVGLSVFGQPIGGFVDCDETVEIGNEVFPACDIDNPVGDTEAPVISIVGANPLSVEVTQDPTASYADPGATASDNIDGNVSGSIVMSGAVDLSIIGTYEITYTVADASGNPATATRTVNVVDTTAPSITAPGDISIEATGPQTVVDLNAGSVVASDNSGNVTVTSNAPADFALGTTVVTWTATDGAGLSATDTQSVTVVDTTPPSIILNTVDVGGTAVVNFTLEAGTAYTEAGAVVGDLVDPAPVLIVTGNVDVNTVGSYDVTYTATDASGNSASAVRTITVVDNTAPVLDFPPVITQAPPFVVDVDESTFTLDWQFGVTDPDSSITVSCDISAVDDPSTVVTTLAPTSTTPVYTFNYAFSVGTTSVTCYAEDSSGNIGEGTFEVTVLDESAPVFDIVADPLVVSTTSGDALVDVLGNVTVSDVVSGDLVPSCTIDSGEAGDPRPVTGDVSLAIGAEATVSCSATDASGNTATADFSVLVQFAYGIQIVEPKGNVNAGSVLPIDWYYVDPATGQRVDSSTFMPSVEWFGPFASRANCTTDATGSSDGSTAADDAGSSDFRYSSSDSRWRLNWATPAAAGYYRVNILPPDSAEGRFCVRLR